MNLLGFTIIQENNIQYAKNETEVIHKIKI